MATKKRIVKAVETYAEESDLVPLAGYMTLMAAYLAVFSGLHVLSSRKESKVGQTWTARDLALLSIASYKFSRIVTMSFIASPIRAPFTTRGESLKAGEVQDKPRGRGLQRAMGSLLTCPFCFNVWSTTGFVFLHSISPNVFRRVGTILSVAAAGDVLHLGYRNLREHTD